MEFIFMLTQDDRTRPDAQDIYQQVAGTDLTFVGFKDIGVTAESARRLTDTMHEDGRTVFMEVVSTSRDDELRSIETALAIGADYVLGGTHIADAIALIAGSSARYCPFPGTITGHPSQLRGSIEEIAKHSAELTALVGVHGVDLLAYRHREVVPEDLVRAVQQSANGPVIVAGSIDRESRIRSLAQAGAWAFTIGGAIFEGQLPGGPSIAAQVDWVLGISRE